MIGEGFEDVLGLILGFLVVVGIVLSIRTAFVRGKRRKRFLADALAVGLERWNEKVHQPIWTQMIHRAGRIPSLPQAGSWAPIATGQLQGWTIVVCLGFTMKLIHHGHAGVKAVRYKSVACFRNTRTKDSFHLRDPVFDPKTLPLEDLYLKRLAYGDVTVIHSVPDDKKFSDDMDPTFDVLMYALFKHYDRFVKRKRLGHRTDTAA